MTHTDTPEEATVEDPKPTVLIVDDAPANLTVLGELLQSAYNVRAAISGEAALRSALKDPCPDLIMLDVMMPEMDGYAVFERLRADPATAGIPVIFVTAMDSTEAEMRGLELGAVDYITKPIEPSIVLARVRTQLELKAARDQLATQNILLEARVAERTQALMEALSEIESAHSRMKKAYFGTLMAINEVAELRGGSIRENSRRVAALARQVAGKLDLSAADVQDVFVAALLHDIGTIGFPDGLLNKPVSVMTSEELATYRRHPGIGADALKKIEALADIADLVRYHHEHFDGSGFPEGLSGLDIPLGARIIGAISDYEALKAGALTDQPMSPKQACQYLLEGQGGRYDPRVIGVLEPILATEERFTIDDMAVSAAHLQEGMTLSRDVHHPNGFVLLSKGSVLSRRLIDQMVAVERQSGATLKVRVERGPVKRPPA